MSAPPQARGRLSMQPRGLNIYAPQSCTNNARTCRISCARSGMLSAAGCRIDEHHG